MSDLFPRSVLFIACVLLIDCGRTPVTAVAVIPTVGDNGALSLQPPGPYSVGTRVTLTAAPAAGYVVDAWSGTDDDASKSSINHVTISPNSKAVSVTFAVATGGPFHLTLPASVANGSLSVDPVEPPGGYPAGTKVVLTATPANGFALDAWTGTDDPTATSLTNQVTMVADETVDVSFKTTGAGYLLTLDPVGNVTLAAVASIPSQPGPSYIANTVVSLTATLGATGHKVVWTNTDDDASTATTNTVTIGATPVTVTATAACDTHCTLTVAVDNPAFGHVTVNDGTQNLLVNTQSGSTSIQSLVGHTLNLRAHDSLNWPFPGWASPVVPTNGCMGTIAMTSDRTVFADFPDVPAHAANCTP